MTANIVYHGTRESFTPTPTAARAYATTKGLAIVRDLVPEQTASAGQLWERLADTTLNQDALTGPQWSRMAVARNQLGSRRSGLDWDVIGPLAFSDNRGYNDGYSIQASGTVQYGILAYSLLTRRPNTNNSGE